MSHRIFRRLKISQQYILAPASPLVVTAEVAPAPEALTAAMADLREVYFRPKAVEQSTNDNLSDSTRCSALAHSCFFR